MSQINNRRKTGEHFCATYLKQATTSIEWTIANFNLLQIGSNCIESSSFESFTDNVHTGSWKLKLYPNCINKDNVGLFFVCFGNQDIVFVKCEACIIDVEGQEVNKKDISAQLTSKELGFVDFIIRSDLVESLIPNGNLTIHCSATVTYRNQTQFKRNDDGEISDGCSLRKDFSKLLKEELLSDAVLLCDGRKFPVHKCVLSARSSVFRTMFTHGFNEKEENLIEMKNVDQDVLQNLLSYIYTDNILDCSTTGKAIKLLEVADKHILLELKGICEEYLKKNISIHNFLDIAVTANLHSLESLKEVSIDFMCKHGNEIVFLDTTKDLFSAAPKYLLEGVLKQLFAGRSSQNELVPNQIMSVFPPINPLGFASNISAPRTATSSIFSQGCDLKNRKGKM